MGEKLRYPNSNVGIKASILEQDLCMPIVLLSVWVGQGQLCLELCCQNLSPQLRTMKVAIFALCDKTVF